MNYTTILLKLYHLLVNSDGTVNDREVAMGRQMVKAENISPVEFDRQIELIKKRKQDVLYIECLEGLKKLDHEKQVRCLAWISLVANADGFMDKTEWQFIYKIYHTELGLQLDEIMKKQKVLMGLNERSPRSVPAEL